jgi:hypothetical protein
LLASTALTNEVIAIAPVGLAAISDGEPRVEATRDAEVHAASPASELVNSAGVTATPLLSTFQMDLVAVKCILPVTWTRRHSAAVAWLQASGW